MLKTKKFIAVIILFLFIAATVFAASADTEVYITKTGDKYHRVNCSYLKSSKIRTTLGDAVSRGYGHCSRCNLPELD
jgi:hypothetical protein